MDIYYLRFFNIETIYKKGIIIAQEEPSKECSFYAILGTSRIKKNRESFFININRTWDSFYLFDIDIIKNKLVSVKKCAYLPIGADEQYYYGIEDRRNFLL